MKKFINQVELVEDQMIAGMVKAYPQYVRKLDCGNVVVRTEKKEGKVALTPAQLSMLLEGIDWRAPERTWRPLAAG